MTISKATQNKLFTAGYTAKGVVYLIMGIFAVATVIGASSGTGGPKAVIDWIGTNPFGQILIGLIGLGLMAYAAWRWFKALANTENEGSDTTGIVKRIGWAVSGTAYGVLSVYAFKKLFGSGGGSGNQKEDIIAQLLQQSWGPYAVGLIGVIMVGVGAYQVYRAATDKHVEDVDAWGLTDDQEEAFKHTGRVGLGARAVVYGIIAYFLFRAATMSDADQFKGIGESLSYLRDATFGSALLAIVGMGLAAYGIFMFFRARYERV
ncbi:MAG: DUF1206 domain-containing protein [Saprospiraceae bacterium]